MAVCQMMTGSGGWPTTLVLTPQTEALFRRRPTFPGTSRAGMAGLVDLLEKIAELWLTDRSAASPNGGGGSPRRS